MFKFTLSPKNDLDINSLRVALINFIVAQQRGEGFIILIDDINLDIKDSKEAKNLEILRKFAIDTQNTIYRSKRLNIYQEFAYKLIKENKAFICFCNSKSCKENCKELSNSSLKALKDEKKEFTIKLFKPAKEYSFNDLIYSNISSIDEIEDIDILNRDGTPTEIFASAIDDMTMGVALSIREENHLNSSAKEIYIRELLGFNEEIKYAHIPTILSTQKIFVEWLFKEGFIPDAIINYLISLNHNSLKEIFYLPQIVGWFDITKFSDKRVDFDLNRLKYFNKEHLKAMDSIKLSSIFGFRDRDIGELLKLLLDSANTINELEEKFKPIFSKKNCNSKMKVLSNAILQAPFIEEYDEFINYLKKCLTLDDKELLELLKKVLLGYDSDIELNKIYPYLKSYLLEVSRCQ